MALQDELEALAKVGCFPCVSLRGHENEKPVWRAHVNGAGCFWADASTPLKALREAVKLWVARGKKMDGYASGFGGPYDTDRDVCNCLHERGEHRKGPSGRCTECNCPGFTRKP